MTGRKKNQIFGVQVVFYLTFCVLIANVFCIAYLFTPYT